MSEKEEKEAKEDSCFGHLEFWMLSSLFRFLNSEMSNWRAINKVLYLRRAGDRIIFRNPNFKKYFKIPVTQCERSVF